MANENASSNPSANAAGVGRETVRSRKWQRLSPDLDAPPRRLDRERAASARAAGLSPKVVRNRVRKGWSLTDALRRPVAKRPPRPAPRAALCEAHGVKYGTFAARLRAGFSEVEALLPVEEFQRLRGR